MKKLWGDNYYDPQKRHWNTTGHTEDGKKLDRGFVRFIMTPIVELSNNIMQGNLDKVWGMT
jgi:hypothetical protein